MVALVFTVTVGPDRPRGEVLARPTLRSLEGLPRVARLAERFAVPVTWLLTWPVVARDEGDWFGAQWASGSAEVGICHEPWNTPPFAANEDRLVPHPPCAVPGSAVQAKLEALTDIVVKRYGRSPVTHRASGGGLDGPSLQAIERLGYLADVSVEPLADNREAEGIDWRAAPAVPYFPDRQRPTVRGACRVLEVPVTAGYDRPLPESIARGLSRLPGIDGWLGKALAPVARRAVLDPSRSDLGQMQDLAEAAVVDGAPCLHVTVRGEALHPGCSALCPEPDDVEAALERLDAFLRFAVDSLRAEPMTVEGFVRHHLALRDPQPGR